jgi:CRISPR-associated endonuclease Csn1
MSRKKRGKGGYMEKETILGIDLGSNSIGWALFNLEGKKPSSFVKTGIRIFEAGLEGLDLDGKGKSRNINRREARLRRRQYERRSRRLENLARLLQRFGLLPDGNLNAPQERHDFFTRLDKTHPSRPSPYQLRADALMRKLDTQELGRSLYHIGQRRGFLSNRKAPLKKDEERGKVKTGIAGLRKEIEEAGAQTLGEHFSKLDKDGARIRGRYTARKMYEDEFNRIWEAQRQYHPAILTDELKKRVHRAIFYQRPLKSQKELIGECSIEKGCKRAPWALLSTQRFRYLQRVNDLRILDKKTFNERPLSVEEKSVLIDTFETEGDLTFAEMRRRLKLPKGTAFNLETGGEKKLPGNRTSKTLSDVFKERWKKFTEDDKNAVVEEVRSVVKDETLKKRGMKVWYLDEKTAEEFGGIELEEGYCNFSKKAIEKLLPLLMKGKSLATAINEAYPGRRIEDMKSLDYLPAVRSEVFGDIRNPIVERALTELRKVLNAIIKEYGKPGIFRIELARDLRRSSKQRESAWKNMRENEGKRKEAAKKIIEETGITKPKPSDILKVLLAEECDWKCPYTGRPIGMKSLIGEHPQFDVEHIIPFDRSLDNSFFNKTLCWAEENRNRKHNKTPYEAYSGTERWEEILERVKNFKGEAAREKFKRFKYTEKDLEEIIDSFSSRQLNDTRYASRLAKRYIGLLYGGLGDDGIDIEGKRRVQATTGQITAHLRNSLGLNAILGDGPDKSRDDHRHHAVDAAAIALTGPDMVKMLSDAAKNSKGRRLFGAVVPPWRGFFEDMRREIQGIIVSRRVSKRVRGALHEETFYSEPKKDKKGKSYVHIRKPISDLSKSDLEDIVDNRVKKCVLKRLDELGGEPKKAFKDPSNHPFIETKDGRKIPIHKVRIKRNLETFPVGKGRHVRYVQSDSNHHMEIVKTIDKNGKEKWEGYVVDMLEAYRRKTQKEPIIKKDHGEGKEILISLANGEIIELDTNDGKRELFVIRTVPKSKQIYFAPISDSRKLTDIGKKDLTSYPDGLRVRNCKKVVVTPLGEVRYAND